MILARLKIKPVVLTVLFGILSINASATGFKEAYTLAIKNDPTYQTSVHSRDAAQENVIIGRSSLLPSVSASYDSSRNVAEINTVAGATKVPEHPRYHSRSAEIQVRQPLLSLEGTARYRQGKVATAKGGADFTVSTDELALRVAGAYMDVLYAEDQVSLARVAREMYLEQMYVNKRLFESGEGTKTDMLETQARLDLAEVQLIEAHDSVTSARQNLTGIIGTAPGQLDMLKPEHNLSPIDSHSFEYWEDLAQSCSAELLVGQLAVESARLEINRNHAGQFPRIDLVATYNKGDSESINTYTQNSVNRSIGLQINIPIYQGGAISASTRQAMASYSRAQSELDARRNKLLVDLRKAWSQVHSGERKINALAKAVDSGKMLMTATEKSIKGGARINLDLLNAQQRLYSSQLDYARANYDYLLAILKLHATAGVLDNDALDNVASNFRKKNY